VVSQCIQIAREDWDSFETSWNFSCSPLLRDNLKADHLQASWSNWQNQTANAIAQLQYLEGENNAVFLDSYGLREELPAEVPEEQITLARADRRRDMASFLSYAIGCLMGRYSLDPTWAHSC